MKVKCIKIDEFTCIHVGGEYEILQEIAEVFILLNDQNCKWGYPKELFEIIPDKILITDQMIEDFLKCGYDKAYSNGYFNEIKANLKQKGYAVEESKTKLDEARELRKNLEKLSFRTPTSEEINQVYDMYESYIEKIKELKDER